MFLCQTLDTFCLFGGHEGFQCVGVHLIWIGFCGRVLMVIWDGGYSMVLNRFSKMITYSLFTLGCLGGCSVMPKVPVSFNINAANNINSDEHELSLPVQVRIYQLTDLHAFKEATFNELWKMDKKVLGDSFLYSKEISITPNYSERIKIDRKEGAQYIGVVALFRHPELGKWRAYKTIQNQASSMMSSMKLTVTGNSIRIK